MSSRPLRRRRVTAGLASLVAVALITMGVTPTLASWNDREWASGAGAAGAAVTTLDCANPAGRFATRGEGRALGGGLLGFDLDALAAASSMLVTNSGSATSHTAGGTAATPAPDAFANPLNVTALRAVNANLGGGILQLPLNNATGVIGQYGRASSDGRAVGAAGYVTDNGGIALKPAGGYPDLATLSLSQLLSQINPAVAGTLANVSDVSLTVGAVAGRATVDGCAGTWANDVAGSVTRDYLTAALRAEVRSPAVGTLVGDVSAAVTGLENAVNGLTSNTGVLTSIRNGVTGLVNGVLSGNLLGVRLGSVTIDSLSATIDTTAVRALLTQSFGDAGGVLTVSPSAGVVTVDTAALLASAYPGSYSNGLNGLAPNTNLLSDPAVVTALSSALTGALNAWITRVNTALSQAIDAISISVKLKVLLQLQVCVIGCLYVDLVSIAVTSSGTLTSLTTSTSTTVLGIGLLTPLIDALLGNVVAALVGGVGGVVQGAVAAVVNGLRALGPTVTAGVTPIVTAVSNVYTRLFINGVVSLIVNAQNAPGAAPTPGPVPGDLAGLPSGRFDVAALRIGVLGALSANDVRLYLGRGSVGRVCLLPAAAAGCPGY